MTSSLVGSEMCIRDRSLSALWRTCVGPSEEPREACEGVSPGGEQRGAVSYTHLTLPTICSV
eukprot:8424908-Prorocentrum_lima.AAC.1